MKSEALIGSNLLAALNAPLQRMLTPEWEHTILSNRFDKVKNLYRTGLFDRVSV